MRSRLLCLAVLAGLGGGCSGLRVRPEPPAEPSPPAPRTEASPQAPSPGVVAKPAPPVPPSDIPGERLASRAAALVGVRSLAKVTRRVPDDCTGLVRLVYQGEGIELMGAPGGKRGENGVTAIHRRARLAGALHRRTPRPGDLVFFRETYDRNRDGRRNDGLTHVGIVESVAPDETVTFIHRGAAGVERSRLNLRAPRSRTGPQGQILNDYLRRRTARTRAYLTGELFTDFGSPERL